MSFKEATQISNMKQRLRKLIALASQLLGATRIGEALLEAVIQGGWR